MHQLLCCQLSQIFKRNTHNQCILSDSQSGFRSNQSTTTTLLEVHIIFATEVTFFD